MEAFCSGLPGWRKSIFPLGVGAGIEISAGELGPIVGGDDFWEAALLTKAVQKPR